MRKILALLVSALLALGILGSAVVPAAGSFPEDPWDGPGSTTR